MSIRVFHNPEFLDCFGRQVPDCIEPPSLYLAAIVDTDEPTAAYAATQHVDADWYNHPAVTTVVRSRSTAVGDVLATEDGRLLAVMPFGYQRLSASLPFAESRVAQALQALRLRAEGEGGATLREIGERIGYLYTALVFALPLLEQMADDVDRPDPHQALLARFAAEQARWALAQADGGQ